MEYLDGIGLEELDENDKDKFCEIVSKFGIKSIFFNGFVHGDLHQGNCKFIVNNTIDYNADTDTDSEDESESVLLGELIFYILEYCAK